MKRNRPLAILSALSVIISLSFGIRLAAAANPNCNEVDGDYIVSFTKNVNSQAEMRSAPGRAIAPAFVYDNVLNGFAASLTAEQVCAFKKRPNIEFVEADQSVQMVDTQTLSSDNSIWGLDRVDQRNLTLNLTYSYTSLGNGIKVYVVDTGIRKTHQDFGGRVLSGYSAIKGSSSTDDCNGHGTHVSGTIAGKTFGIAKNANLVPVRVLGCNGSGTNSGVIAGLNWIAKNSQSNLSVVNMSLGGGASSTLDSAVNNLIGKGVVVVVAAGNSTADACTSSPARVPNAITVAASDVSDNFAYFSNFGTCVDVIAPGVYITSDSNKSDVGTAVMSGTSMASPHVAGAVARYLSVSLNSGTLLANSTLGSIQNTPSGTVNKLLYLDPSK